jgi:nucleotide-binding universal stress UspA family protein
MYRNILVSTDGSGLSDRALKAAAGLAKLAGAKLVLFHCVPPPIQMPVYSEGLSLPHVSRQKAHKAAVAKAHRVLAAAAKKAAAAAGIAAGSEYAISASPHDAIVAAVQRRKCDLIVMASHGRSGLSRFLIGSVTQAVLSRTKVPVLVVR